MTQPRVLTTPRLAGAAWLVWAAFCGLGGTGVHSGCSCPAAEGPPKPAAVSARPSFVVTPEERRKIEEAIPANAIVPPGAIEDWPEFGRMLGARGARHRENTEPVFVRLDDPAHPLVAPFGGKGFEYRDEFFRVSEPYSRDRLRVLLSIDTQKTDLERGPFAGRRERSDNDYALAWVRHYGKGRVFYSTIAHNPRVFWDPVMLRFYLGAVQFALGDLPAPTLPSSRLTPAARAQEKLGWRLAITAYTFHKYTLFETNWLSSTPEAAACIAFFNNTCLRLAK